MCEWVRCIEQIRTQGCVAQEMIRNDKPSIVALGGSVRVITFPCQRKVKRRRDRTSSSNISSSCAISVPTAAATV
eukprot:COSAG06_NODE_611_length_13818_cov_9.629346_5_plen_75_part_00